MARCAQAFKDRAVARLQPPESASVKAVSRELRESVATLERCRAAELADPEIKRSWPAAARLEAVMTAPAMDEASRSAWRREMCVFPSRLERWFEDAVAARDAPEEAPSTLQPARVGHYAGAWFKLACEPAGIAVDNQQRYRHGGGLQHTDRRSQGVRSRTAFALTSKSQRQLAAAGGRARVISH